MHTMVFKRLLKYLACHGDLSIKSKINKVITGTQYHFHLDILCDIYEIPRCYPSDVIAVILLFARSWLDT